MAFVHVFSFLSIVIIVTVTVTRLQNTSTLNLTKMDQFNGSHNVSIPGRFLTCRVQDGSDQTVQKILESESCCRMKHLYFLDVQKRSGPDLFDRMDIATEYVQPDQLLAPGVISKNLTKPPAIRIWEKMLFDKKYIQVKF